VAPSITSPDREAELEEEEAAADGWMSSPGYVQVPAPGSISRFQLTVPEFARTCATC